MKLKKHLLKYFSIDPFAKIKMEKYANNKKRIHNQFFTKISQTTNENKFLMGDLNKVSPKSKVQSFMNKLKQNPVPLKKNCSSYHHNKKFIKLNEENFNYKDMISLPTINTSTGYKK